MQNMYFKGLNKVLNEGGYVKVFLSALRYPVVRVERIENNKVCLVSYSENSNVLAALNAASGKIICELTPNNNPSNPVICENTLIDKVVNKGFSLHFYKLSNNKILSTICTLGENDYIPIKSVITDDIYSGFEKLNESLSVFDFDNSNNFTYFVNLQRETSYQKKLTNK